MLDNSLVANYCRRMNEKYNILPSLMARKVRLVNRFIEEELHSAGWKDIVPSHGEILYALFYKKKMTMKELADKIDRDKSTLTGLINKLLKKELIKKEKNPADSRSYHIKLTQKGRAMEPLFTKISDNLLSKFFQNISFDEKAQLFSLMNKISME